MMKNATTKLNTSKIAKRKSKALQRNQNRKKNTQKNLTCSEKRRHTTMAISGSGWHDERQLQ